MELSSKLVASKYAKTLLERTYTSVHKKFDDICSAILKSNDALVSSNPHANFLAFLFSYQSRFDYWLSTNSIEHTDPPNF